MKTKVKQLHSLLDGKKPLKKSDLPKFLNNSSVNFRRLQVYNLKFFPDLDYIVFFEFLIVFSESVNKKGIDLSYMKVEKDALIKISKQKTIIDFLINEGLANYNLSGYQGRKKFFVNYEGILDNFDKIYRIEELGGEEFYNGHFKNLLTVFQSKIDE